LSERIQRALLWTISAGAFGVLLWGFSFATVYAVVEQQSWQENVALFFIRQLAILPFSGFVALLALPPYMLIFWLWQLVVERNPTLESSDVRVALWSLVLASPSVAVLTFNFGSDLFAEVGLAPIIIVSCWGGVWAPRRFVRRLRPRSLASLAG
jgi:hypothetical protein